MNAKIATGITVTVNPTLPDATGGWAGLSNYTRLLHDSQFGHALLVTMIFVVVAVGRERCWGRCSESFSTEWLQQDGW
jgi:ABC-type sugar transport system permease subunit